MRWSMAVSLQRDLINEGECAISVIDAVFAARPTLEVTVPLMWSMDVFTRRDLHGRDCANAVTDGCVNAARPASWR